MTAKSESLHAETHRKPESREFFAEKTVRCMPDPLYTGKKNQVSAGVNVRGHGWEDRDAERLWVRFQCEIAGREGCLRELGILRLFAGARS